jgi:hypothetical protein
MKFLCGLSYVVLTILGALNMKRVLGFLFGVLATLWMAAPAAAAWGLNDSQQPGSVLVFPKFVRGVSGTAVTLGLANTQLEISVTCPKTPTAAGLFCTDFQPVILKAHWVCGGSAAAVCQENDFRLFTTVNGTIYFNPENVAPNNVRDQNGVATTVPNPQCNRGYLIVWVVDGSDNPIKFDGLIGDAVIRTQTPPPPTDGEYGAGEYNALPIQADPILNTGDFTDLDSNGMHTGALQFDGSGSHYQEVTGTVFGTVRYPTPTPTPATVTRPIATSLTLLTLDTRSNQLNNPTFVTFNFYNEFEKLESSPSTTFFCWEEVPLQSIDTNLNNMLTGYKGLVQSTSAAKEAFVGISDDTGPVTLVGLIETDEGFLTTDSQNLNLYFSEMLNDGQPVPTTFYPLPPPVVPW